MESPNKATRNSSQQKSSSSAITIPPREGDTGSTFRDGEGNRPIDYFLVIWTSIVAFLKSVTASLYESTVNFVAVFLADVASHPRLQSIFEDLLVASINAFLDQEDIGTKLDDAARRVMYDTESSRRDASHALGKEVVPVVTGFLGGVASSLKPSEFKKRGKQRKERKSSQSIQVNNRSDLTRYESSEEEDEDLCHIKKTK